MDELLTRHLQLVGLEPFSKLNPWILSRFKNWRNCRLKIGEITSSNGVDVTICYTNFCCDRFLKKEVLEESRKINYSMLKISVSYDMFMLLLPKYLTVDIATQLLFCWMFDNLTTYVILRLIKC